MTSASEVGPRRRYAESEEYFRNLIESAPDLITVIEATGVIKYQSPAIERTLGYTQEELVGTNVWICSTLKMPARSATQC